MAVCSIGAAPFVANAPAGLYQLLQQLNGIFFIPMATLILAALFMPWISSLAAKVGLIFGLLFYILLQFVFKVDLHFVHIWGLEFVINIALMTLVSRVYKNKNTFKIKDEGFVAMAAWKYALPLSIILVLLTLLVYLTLGHIS